MLCKFALDQSLSGKLTLAADWFARNKLVLITYNYACPCTKESQTSGQEFSTMTNSACDSVCLLPGMFCHVVSSCEQLVPFETWNQMSKRFWQTSGEIIDVVNDKFGGQRLKCERRVTGVTKFHPLYPLWVPQFPRSNLAGHERAKLISWMTDVKGKLFSLPPICWGDWKLVKRYFIRIRKQAAHWIEYYNSGVSKGTSIEGCEAQWRSDFRRCCYESSYFLGFLEFHFNWGSS